MMRLLFDHQSWLSYILIFIRMHVFVNFGHYLWIEPKSGIVAYKALQYSQITDNIYEAFMMAWGQWRIQGGHGVMAPLFGLTMKIFYR